MIFRLPPVLALLGAALFWAPAFAEVRGLPVPTQVIYPGDRITEALLTDSTEASSGGMVNVLWDHADLVGKVARRTLLPGRPIPSIAVEEPRAVSTGTQVQLIYSQDGISIVTSGQALQNGFIGQSVQVRNLDSGIVISGTVVSDGSVRANGG
jgi:flagella basal body P-ring formation protein FlgA